jgi:hypothetical protein
MPQPTETFVGSLKRECLNYFMCFNEDQLDYICLRRSRSERVAVQL